MFERFDDEARAVVVSAQEEARNLRHGWIGTEHVLLGVLRTSGTRAAAELERAGVTLDVLREHVRRRVGPCDADALRSIGIDLDAVRTAIEDVFGPGALDPPRRIRGRRGRRRHRFVPARPCSPAFTPRAKKVLELALRHAMRTGSRHIRPEHIVLGILTEGEGLAVQVLVDSGIDVGRLRARIEEGLRAA